MDQPQAERTCPIALEIRWLKRALANLDAEAAFIARDDPAAARVVEAIWRCTCEGPGNPPRH
ncbi:MAG TPA: type II toxin-antitoxin system RelE/ParE family toxin [Terriglobia bacterium]|nr:type II toxin-antitoxin system RelE/ParE family toxin [Terriglobia bacterium]